jgi:hypothetical protein
MSLAGMVAGIIAILAFIAGDRPRKGEVIGFTMIVLFTIYISFLPKADGGLTRWYFVLPTMLALFIFEDERRADLVKAFSFIFALSVLPGVIVSLCSIIGIYISFDHKPLLNPVMAAAGGYYLNVPGVLLLGNNVSSLPWGGALYRLCAVYDEPGMVGTIAAFLLAARRFRIKSPVSVIVFAAGLLSFSLAFAVLTVAGFAARVVLARSAKAIIPLALCILAGLLAAGVIKPDAAPGQPAVTADKISNMAIAAQSDRSASPEAEPADRQEKVLRDHVRHPGPTQVRKEKGSGDFSNKNIDIKSEPARLEEHESLVVASGSTLRQTQYINNRSLPEMQKLINDYWSSDFKTLMLGVSSDASVVYGGVSQVVTRIFTDFGIVGMLLFAGAMILLAIAVLRRADNPIWAALFFALFLLSVYQRPVVWMPYAFTLFICCPVLAAMELPKRRKSESIS